MNPQLGLFDRIVTINAHGLSLEDQFNAFHQANPHVYSALRRLSLDTARHGRRLGIGMLFEVLRWQYAMTTTDEASEFKWSASRSCRTTSRHARRPGGRSSNDSTTSTCLDPGCVQRRLSGRHHMGSVAPRQQYTVRVIRRSIRGTMDNTLREQLADEQHAIWAHWMNYMFTCGSFSANGSWTMPAAKVERWQRQMDTPYSDLSDKERESDRHQADKVLGFLSSADPFTPDWSTAPTWAEYHTIDKDGSGCWWGNAGIVLGATAWYHDAETLQHHIGDTHSYDLTGLDWRNSLRAKPSRE